MATEDQSFIEPLAIFGGTFDPVHYGHLRCADDARQKLKLKDLCLLPSGHPPHRLTPSATTAQRLQMLQLALTEFPQLLIDDRETRREGPSYMVDTLKELRSEGPQRPIMLLIGQDAANDLHTWHHWEQLFELAHIVVLTRPDTCLEYRRDLAEIIQNRACLEFEQLHSCVAGRVLQLEVASIDISATDVKKLICSGNTLKSMLPEAVIRFINENHLYSSA